MGEEEQEEKENEKKNEKRRRIYINYLYIYIKTRLGVPTLRTQRRYAVQAYSTTGAEVPA